MIKVRNECLMGIVLDKKDVIALIRGINLDSYNRISIFGNYGFLDFCGNNDHISWKEQSSSIWDKYNIKELYNIYLENKN